VTDGGPRIGVIACSCWSRSETGIDADSIVAHALQLDHVVHAEATDDLCGTGHAELASDLVTRHSLDRLVVAACACCPQTQRCAACNDERAGLREAVKSATGLPWAHHAFVNVKDHYPVPYDADTAVSMAVAYLAEAQDLVPDRAVQEPVRAALVVGAGARGRAVAVELGERGFHTHLVDQSSPAGTVETAPPNVTLHAPARVEVLSGGGGRFLATLARMGDEIEVEVGAVVVAPGLAEERTEGGIGWGLPHLTMSEPPRRVQGMFLVTEDGVTTAGAAAAYLGRSVKGAEAMACVDAEACIGCLKCERVCPYGAVSERPLSMGAGLEEVTSHVVQVDPLLCTGCGACSSACLNWAVEQTGYATRQLETAIKAAASRTRSLLVVCNWAAYRAYDKAALEGALPKGLAVLRVPCIARISPHIVQVALEGGVDPLVLAGCSEQGCHYRDRRALLDEHLSNMEPGLGKTGDIARLFVLTLGPADRDVLATRIGEAVEERRYAREEATEGAAVSEVGWSRGWG
jgi:coenzyme F420-reducing hydrogenase delta subunit/ferredoxin